MRVLVTVVSWIVAVAGVAECQRAAPESFSNPGPGPGRAPADAAHADTGIEAYQPVRARTDTSGRCVTPTLAQPPAAVPPGADPRCPLDPTPQLAALPMVQVGFADASGVTVEAELAKTEEQSSRGLMYRKQMDEDHGMLFDLRERSEHAFWMHNTCIPLDMLFIDREGFIAGIVENAPTLNDEGRSVECPVNYVLEVNASWSRRHGVRAGQRVILPR